MKPQRKNTVRVHVEAEERKLMQRFYDVEPQNGNKKREEDNLRAFYKPIS